MGLSCCRPARDITDAAEHATVKIVALTRDHLKNNEPQPIDSDDEEWWEAASMQSASSVLSLGDALEQWQVERRSSLDELGAEVAEAVRSGARLVPEAVESAATDRLQDTGRPIASTYAHAADTLGASHVGAAPGAEEREGALLHAWHAVTAALHHRPSGVLAAAAAAAEIKAAAALRLQGRVLAAHARLETLCQRSGLHLGDLQPHSPALGINVAGLEAEVHAVHAALSQLQDDAGWMVAAEGDLRVLYRHEKGGTCHSLRCSTVFCHPVAHILAMANEWDLLPTWNRFCIDAIQVAELGVFESVVYGCQWMMRPFRPMQVLARARGYDLAEERRCLLILIADADVDALPPGHAPLPKAMPARRTVNVLPGSCITLRPLPVGPGGEFRTEAHIQVHLDPHIPYVPAMLVNFVLGVLAPYLFNQMRRVLDTAFGGSKGKGVVAEGVFPQRIAARPELYGLIEARMEEFAAELRLQSADRAPAQPP